MRTTRPQRRTAISLALAILASVLSLVAVAAVAPAASAAADPTVAGRPCAPGVGVTVVIDYQQLGGIEVGCAPGQQADGFAALANAGFRVNDKPGALAGTVCQIHGQPSAGYPACWYDGFWSYGKSDGTEAWKWSDTGASAGPLAVDRVEGWSWTAPIPEEYTGAPMRIAVGELDDLLLGDADCTATVQLPTFDIVDDREVLPVSLADGHPVEVAILTDPGADPATATWAEQDAVLLSGLSGKVRILARRTGDECANAPTFDATYDVRAAYAPRWNSTGAGSPSPALDKASTAFVGWATGHSQYTPGGNVNTGFQTPANAYGPIDSSLVVLGDRGSITLTFGAPITDGPGYDFAPFENGFASGALDYLEFAYVEVSSNGTDFVRFDSASRRAATVAAFGTQDPAEIGGLAGKDLSGKGTPFDLSLLKNKPEVRSGAVDLRRITHVRLKDIQGDGNDKDSFGRPIYDPNPVTGSAGYDLTGVGVINALDEVAPVVAITSAPTGTTAATDAEIAFTVDDGSATVERQLDGGAWTAASSPFTLSGLAAGAHTVTVRATDPSGNAGTASATWTVLGPRDCAAGPVVPDLGIIDSDEVLPVALADGHPVEVAVLTDPSADPATATYATADQVDLSAYEGQRIRIVARAADDPCTGAPTFDAVYDVRDAYAPRVGLDTAPGQPSEGIAREDARFLGWATGYERYRPGTNVADTWKAPFAAEAGPLPDRIAVLGDRGTIDLTFDHPVRDGEGPDLAVFENGFAVNPVGNGLDFLELARVAVTSDGEHWATFDAASRRAAPVGAYEGQRADELGGLAGKDLAGYGTPFDLTNLRNAPEVRAGLVDLDHVIKVRIIDVTGDGDDLDAFGRPIYDPYPGSGSGGFDLTGVGVINQTTPVVPVVAITSGPDGRTSSTSASIAFTATPGDRVSSACRLDGGDWAACTSPATINDLGDGEHTFEVRATRLGSEPGSDTLTWTVDATAPVVEITDAPSGTVHHDDATIEFTVDDDDAVVEQRIDGGTWTATSSPIELDDLADGSHTVEVRAVDDVLNVGTDSATWTVQLDQYTADESWFTAATTDFLGRAPTTSELSAAVARLQAGTKRSTVAKELSSSDEWVRAVVTRFYDDTLTREPDAAGLSYWVNQIRSGRRTVAQVAVQFYASNEYYRNIGGGTDATWVTDLYVKLLHRQPDAAGLAYWKGRTASRGRAFVAGSIYGSPESRRDRVDGLYRSLLGRGADPSGVTYWANRIAEEGDLALAVHLASSNEYGRRAEVRFP